MKLTSRGVSSTTIGLVIVLIIVVVAAGAYIALSGTGGKTTVTSTVTATSTASASTSTATATVISNTTATVTATSVSTVISSESTNTAVSATLLEDGSSLLYPAFNLWIANFSQYYPNIHITTGSGGSGKGISEAAAGTVNIGASDAYLTVAQAAANPGLLNIPLAISAQQINYNFGTGNALNKIHLNFTATVLAGIYNGTITRWNNTQIASLQSSSVAAMLPSTAITPIHRADSSGDTFIFTSYLSAGDQYWNKTYSYGTSPTIIPASVGITATGNSGMLTALSTTPGGIAYVGISYLNTATQLGFGNAYLQNRAGNFVAITATNIQSAVNARLSSVPTNETDSLIYAPGANSYPIVNFEYAIVKTTQPSASVLAAIQAFLTWDITYGNQGYYLLQVHFVALPAGVAQLSLNQVASLQT